MFDPLNAPASFFRKKLNPSDFTGNLGALSAATEKPRAPTFARTRPAATAAPTAAAAAPAPETSASYKGGQAIGAVLPMLKRAGEAAWDIGTYPHRKARNVLEDVAAGISGGSPPLPEPLIRAPIPAAAAPAPAPLAAAIAAPAGVAANPAMVTPPAAPVAQPAPAPGALPAAPALTTIAQPTSAVPQIPTIGSGAGGAVGNVAGAAVGSGFTRPTSVAPVTLADINNPFSDAGIAKHNFLSAINASDRPSERAALTALFTRAFEGQNGVALAQQQNDSQREQVAMQTQAQRDVSAQGEQGANARANGRNATDVALEQQRGQNALALAGEQAAPITDGQGKVFTRRGATATPVVDDKGNQISTANGRMTQAEVVKVLSEQLTAAQTSTSPPDPAYIEQLRAQLQSALAGSGVPAAKALPDRATFALRYRNQVGEADEATIEAEYAKFMKSQGGGA